MCVLRAHINKILLLISRFHRYQIVNLVGGTAKKVAEQKEK